jgi:cyclopropane fatty-acyl-phospholipid synthase-like methyltransferase
MGYFDNAKNVRDYIRMVEGYDGRALIENLQKHLRSGSSVLELGMGPGKDMDILAGTYRVTGSDSSRIFLDMYRQTHPEADLLQLDAVAIKTDRRFDCLYSNKVLQHLTKADLERSFLRQGDLLNEGGLLFHSFWWGEKEEVMQGLRFVYYTYDTIKPIVGDSYEWLERGRYKEMKKNDSFYLVLRRV